MMKAEGYDYIVRDARKQLEKAEVFVVIDGIQVKVADSRYRWYMIRYWWYKLIWFFVRGVFIESDLVKDKDD